MRTFTYEIGMSDEEMTLRVEEMIEHMRSDEYWLHRGGNGPYFAEGGELMRRYLDMTDSLNIARRDTLIVPYNRVLWVNMSRPDFVDWREGRTITMTMMSGRELQIDLEHVVSYSDLVSEAHRILKPKKRTRITILEGERELSSGNPRLILTDETELTVVLSRSK